MSHKYAGGCDHVHVYSDSDPIDAAMSVAIRTRQYNPLRAARLYATVAVAQASAAAAVCADAQQDAADSAGALTLSWFLPQEVPPTWIGPVLLSHAERGRDMKRVELR